MPIPNVAFLDEVQILIAPQEEEVQAQIVIAPQQVDLNQIPLDREDLRVLLHRNVEFTSIEGDLRPDFGNHLILQGRSIALDCLFRITISKSLERPPLNLFVQGSWRDSWDEDYYYIECEDHFFLIESHFSSLAANVPFVPPIHLVPSHIGIPRIVFRAILGSLVILNW